MARAPKTPRVDLASLLAQPHPHIDLRLSAYEHSTTSFRTAVDQWALRAAAEITDRKLQHEAQLKAAAEKQRSIEAETTLCNEREIQLVQELEREQEERKTAESTVLTLRRQLASLAEDASGVDEEYERSRATRDHLLRDSKADRAVLLNHASSLEALLTSCAELLGCYCEGINTHQLLFRFVDIDHSDPTVEASFVLDVSGAVPRVLTSTPSLSSLPTLLEDLENPESVFAFVRRVRIAYDKERQPD